MKKQNQETKTDLQECEEKIRALLKEYNCDIISADNNWSGVLLIDNESITEIKAYEGTFKVYLKEK